MEVKLIDIMGSDYSILRAARVSTGAQVSKGEKKDRGLIRYLYRNSHMSPFEFPQFVWYIKCPLFVARQIQRHRSLSINEQSSRYKELDWDVFEPDSWRRQDTENKQSSVDDFGYELVDEAYYALNMSYRQSEASYEALINNGVTREQARMVMPAGHYTEMYVQVDLRNLFHFLELRMDSHAQKETRDVANEMYRQLKELDDFKWSVEIFDEMRSVKEVLSTLLDTHKHDLYGLAEKLKNMD